MGTKLTIGSEWMLEMGGRLYRVSVLDTTEAGDVYVSGVESGTVGTRWVRGSDLR